MLDFGIARKIVAKDENLKIPRRHCGFKGTLRYASINCHSGIELGPKDDVESWLYMIADLSSKDGVPWKFSPSRSDVAQEKKELRTTKRSAIFTDIPCKQEFLAVMDYCDTLGYADIVDYQYIFFLLRLVGSCLVFI